MPDFKRFLPQSPGGEHARFHYALDVLDPLAQAKPDAMALRWVGPGGEVRDFTFAQVARDSRKAARALAAAGLAAGDTVLLLMGDDPLFWPLTMGLHRLGVVAVPISTRLSRQDAAYCLAKAEAKAVVVADAGGAGLVEGFGGQCYAAREGIPGFASLPALMESAPDHPEPELRQDDTQEMVGYFTSGTTGLPLLVTHDFRYPLSHVETGRWLGLTPGGLHLTIAGTGWSKASWGKLYTPWLFECAVLAYAGDPSDGGALIRVLAEHGVDSFCAPPSVYRGLLSAASPLPRLRNATFMAESMHLEVREQFEEMFGIPLRGGYGQTEASLLLAQMPGEQSPPGALGKPVSPWQADIVDVRGESCQPGVSGELVVRGARAMPGMLTQYRGNEEETQALWAGGVFHTGDVAWRDEWGFYWYVGRMDDIIRSAGYRVGPYEVESVLQAHPAVRECAVYGVPDPLRLQIIKTSIVLAEGYEAGDALRKELQQHVRGHTAPYKCPRLVEFVRELPRSVNGKVRRGALREGEAGR